MVAINFFKQQPEKNNDFYRVYQPRFVMVLIGAIIVALVWIAIVVFQVYHRPLPLFYAAQPNGQRLLLQPQDLPNLAPESILNFASKAAVAAFTFDFVNYRGQIGAVRSYFTAAGWDNYLDSVANTVKGIAKNKLFVSAVVNGAAIISNQGVLEGAYSWRVQIPFLVTYQSAQAAAQAKYMVLITIVRVPTMTNPLGIGIDSFVMS